LGFVLAGGLMGFLAERQMGGKLLSSIPMFIIGQVVIYVCGTLWLSHFVGGLSQAVFAGVTPFIVGDVIKIALAALALPVAWRFIKAH
jgi:biotin transport system substrate-specific component